MHFSADKFRPAFLSRRFFPNILVPVVALAVGVSLSAHAPADGSGALAAPAFGQLREALWLAMDRDTIANVLLQREAQPAAALLPQWLSGYAFLFESPMDLQRAEDLWTAFPAGLPGATIRFRRKQSWRHW